MIGLRSTALYSDNIGRDALEESGTIGSVGALLNVLRDGARLDLSIDGSLDYYDYFSDQYDNELLGEANAEFTAAIIPDRLNWVLSDDFGQVRSDPYRPEGPDNRGSVNVVRTGPDVTIPFSERTYASLSGRYSMRRYDQDGGIDGDVTSGELGLHRVLSPTREVGLVSSARRIEYDDATAEPYEVYGTYVTYSQELANSETSVDVGVNRLDFGSQSDTGTLLRASYQRDVTARSTLSLRASREFQDAGDAMSGGFPSGGLGGGTTDVVATTDPLTRSNFGATYRVVWTRTTFAINVDLRENDYESESRYDTETVNTGFSVSRQLSAVTRLEAGADLRREDFQQVDLKTDEWRAHIGLTRQLGSDLDLSLRVETWDRESDQQNSYTENRVLMTITYFPFQR